MGIRLDYSDNIILLGNIARKNLYGIVSFYNSNNTFSGNIVSNNNVTGFNFYNSNNNSLSQNTIKNNDNYGIYLSNSDNNKFSDNTIEQNIYYGQKAWYSLRVDVYVNHNNLLVGLHLQSPEEA